MDNSKNTQKNNAAHTTDARKAAGSVDNIVKLPCRGCLPSCGNYPHCKKRPIWIR